MTRAVSIATFAAERPIIRLRGRTRKVSHRRDEMVGGGGRGEKGGEIFPNAEKSVARDRPRTI